jgi:hypothetical protein
MSILTAAQVMTDNSNHHMLVKEGKSAKSMYLTRLWSTSKTSNKSTSHGEGLIDTEYGLRHNFCSVCVTGNVWWVLDLSHVQELEKDVKIYGSPRFRRVGIVTLSAGGSFYVFVAVYIGHASHVGIVIILLILLKALIAKLFGGEASIIILERILNTQERLPKSSTRRKSESHITQK